MGHVGVPRDVTQAGVGGAGDCVSSMMQRGALDEAAPGSRAGCWCPELGSVGPSAGLRISPLKWPRANRKGLDTEGLLCRQRPTVRRVRSPGEGAGVPWRARGQRPSMARIVGSDPTGTGCPEGPQSILSHSAPWWSQLSRSLGVHREQKPAPDPSRSQQQEHRGPPHPVRGWGGSGGRQQGVRTRDTWARKVLWLQ